MTLKKEITAVLNRYGQEGASNTPDFILAQYLLGCLAAFNTAVQQRETWYGRDARPSSMAECGVCGARWPADSSSYCPCCGRQVQPTGVP